MRKARLVIKGYRQKHGIDYHETFAAVSRMDSIRCIIASAVLREWKLHQFDAVTAFLHGDVDSSIYMELPEGFEGPGYVCRLRRSLYGLKQAPRIWYQCVRRVLAAHGFTMAQSNNCVFYKSNCVISVYVDDFLVAAADSHEIEQVQRALETEFQLNDLGIPRSFPGIQFDFQADGSVSIHQHQYIQKVLSNFGMETCQPKTTDESQASLESPSRRRTSGRGNKSTIRNRHRFVNVSDDRSLCLSCQANELQSSIRNRGGPRSRDRANGCQNSVSVR
jgi:hypothetical protein